MRVTRLAWKPVLLVVVGLGLVSCQSEEVPSPGSEDYETAVTSFYTGVAALQVGENYRAEQQMQRVSKLAPGEPAAWANRGILAAQQNDLEAAARQFERARSLAPDHAPFWLLSGLLERERGNLDRARSHLERVVEIDSTYAPALYTLAQVAEQEGGETALRDTRGLMERLLAQRPDNLALLVERARLAAKAGDEATLRETLDRLDDRSSSWPDAVRSSLRDVRAAASTPSEAASQVAFLKNDLQRVPAYRAARDAVQPPALTGRDSAVPRLFRLSPPASRPAPADTGLTFAPDTLQPAGDWQWLRHATLAEGVPPDVVTSTASS
jgi:Tfp pilus assembly protein PilF